MNGKEDYVDMIRGTTPMHTFVIPFEITSGSNVRIVYAQGEDHKETVRFERTNDTITVDGNKVSITLTREETLLFDCRPQWHGGRCEPLPVKIQVGVSTPTGEILWSNIITTTVDRCLQKDGAV